MRPYASDYKARAIRQKTLLVDFRQSESNARKDGQ